MVTLRLALFALSHEAQRGMCTAGAEMCGGTLRRRRAAAHRELSAEAMRALLGRDGPIA
jgi:hypothetical protein